MVITYPCGNVTGLKRTVAQLGPYHGLVQTQVFVVEAAEVVLLLSVLSLLALLLALLTLLALVHFPFKLQSRSVTQLWLESSIKRTVKALSTRIFRSEVKTLVKTNIYFDKKKTKKKTNSHQGPCSGVLCCRSALRRLWILL